MEIKIFIYWLIILVITYLIREIVFANGNSPFNKKAFNENANCGVLFHFVRLIGVFGFGLYGFIQLSHYFFKGYFL